MGIGKSLQISWRESQPVGCGVTFDVTRDGLCDIQ